MEAVAGMGVGDGHTLRWSCTDFFPGLVTTWGVFFCFLKKAKSDDFLVN